MNNDSDTDRTDAVELITRITDAMKLSGVSCRELTDSLEALAYAFKLLNDERYDFINEECSPELDEFLSCFKVTTEQEVY